jgi:hypothetical protein
VEFFRHYNERYYTGTENVADVAVLRTWPSMAYSIGATLAPPILMEQALIQHKVPFDILYEEQIDTIGRYGAVVLAAQECLSKAQVERLLRYAREGGVLVFTGNTGAFNEWRESRAVNPLRSLVRTDAPAPSYAQREGKGWLVYIPAVVTAGKRAAAQDAENPEIIAQSSRSANRFAPSEWVLPVNHRELIEAVTGHLPNGVSLRTGAPLTTVSEMLNRAESRETIVHFINFERGRKLQPFAVDLRKQFPGKVRSVTRFGADADEPQPVRFEESGGRLRFTAPEMGAYSMIVVAHE